MRFSVIVPVYNVEKYISECIDSILKQSCKDFEIILVDDGSTDKSGAICDKYTKDNKKIKVIHKQNEGLVSARRIGYQNASGDYCISCDSDDFLEVDALEKINRVIDICKPDIIIFSAYYFDGSKKKPFVEIPLPKGIVTDKKELYRVFMTTHSINSLCMKAVKRTLIDIEKDYRAFYKCSYGEDKLQTAPLLVNANIIYYLPERIYNYRYSSGMMRKFNENYYESYKKVNQEVVSLLCRENIPQLDVYSAFNILIAAYGGTTQYKFKKSYRKEEFAKIAEDEDFINSYKIICNTKLKLGFSSKQKLILLLLHLRSYGLIKLLLKR